MNVFVVNGDYAEKKKSFSIDNARVLNEFLVSSNEPQKMERFPSSLDNEDSEERVNCKENWKRLK